MHIRCLQYLYNVDFVVLGSADEDVLNLILLSRCASYNMGKVVAVGPATRDQLTMERRNSWNRASMALSAIYQRRNIVQETVLLL